MKYFYLLSLFFLLEFDSYAYMQNYLQNDSLSLSGVVVKKDDKTPSSYAKVIVQPQGISDTSSYIQITDDKGQFFFILPRASTYICRASYFDMQTKKRAITVDSSVENLDSIILILDDVLLKNEIL